MSNAYGYRNKVKSTYDVKNFLTHDVGFSLVHQLKATNEYVDLIVVANGGVIPIKVIKVPSLDVNKPSKSSAFNESYSRMCLYLETSKLEFGLLFVKIKNKGYLVYKINDEGKGSYSVSHYGKMETRINTWRKGE